MAKSRGRTVPQQQPTLPQPAIPPQQHLSLDDEEAVLDFLADEGLFLIETPKGLGYVWEDDLPPRDESGDVYEEENDDLEGVEISEYELVDCIAQVIERQGRSFYASRSDLVLAAWNDWKERNAS